ncbi:SprT-like domain-containing protein [Paraburkholderia sp. UCT31]|uniref:SprT-like domain-containing protein n=1 Tax=Paraburkholderia sp. UCT31 TaxID=2615209 RepID=UPI001655D400|nr:SprT-like domain-containing protein [Paraburkholderia sp. UCT31]
MLERVAHFTERARELYAAPRTPIRMPAVSFELRGRVGGTANHSENLLRFNALLLMENESEYLRQIVPHEVAHLVAHSVFGAGISPHGTEWQSVMRKFGLEPLRTHSMDTARSRTRPPLDRIAYICTGCRKDYQLSSRMHARVMAGREGRICTGCKRPLRPVDPKLVPREMPGFRAASAPRSPSLSPTPRGGPIRAQLPSLTSRPPVIPPTEKQVLFAASIAKQLGIAVPAPALIERKACSDFLAQALKLKAERSAR